MEDARKQQLIRRAEETVNSASDAAAAMLSQCGYSKEVFARAALTAIMLNPKILECETFSLRKALLGCAQRGLLPDGQSAVIIPEKSGKARLQIGYMGSMDLARRAIKDIVIRGNIVTQDDDEAGGWQYEDGLKPILRHVPNLDGDMPTPKNIIVSYALAFMPGNPQPEFVVLSRKRLDHIRTTYGKSPAWNTEFASMCIKTAIQALCNKLPIRSGLMQHGESFDDDPLHPDVGAADENTGPTVVTPQAAQEAREEFAATYTDPAAKPAAAEKQGAAPEQPKRRGRPRKQQATAAQPPAEEQPPPPEEERPQEATKDWGDVGF